MADTLLHELFRALDLAVIERLPNGTFHMLTPPPVWVERAFEAAPAGGRRSLDAAFPFIEDVVHQAIGAWEAGPHASLVFGPFAATVAEDELLLRATALTIGTHTLLVLDRLVGTADTRPMLQKAREHMLENERLVRQATTVHAPAAALDGAIAALLGTNLSADQRGPADALRDANGQLQAVVAGLPAPPPRSRR